MKPIFAILLALATVTGCAGSIEPNDGGFSGQDGNAGGDGGSWLDGGRPDGGGSCPDDLTDCGGVCVDTNTNSLHCGFCDRVCPQGFYCVGGTCSGCQPECVLGQKRCLGPDSFQECIDIEGCLVWEDAQLCPEGLICDGDGQCVNQCQDQCNQAGTTVCDQGNLAYRTCGQFDQDSCLDLSEPTNCPTGQYCQDGQCMSSCQDTCGPQDARLCSGNGYDTCGDYNNDTCLEWGGHVACPSGTICQGGQCVSDCQDECQPSGNRRCIGDGFDTCENYDSDECLEWGGHTPCPSGYVCNTTTTQCEYQGDEECYTEPVYPDADVSDLRSNFQSGSWGNWKETIFGVLQRRYPSGYDMLTDMQDDPQMANFPDTSSFGDLMASVDTVAHEECHGWDYGHANWSAGTFAFFTNSDQHFEPPEIDGFSCSQIMGMIEDDSTSLYHSYLTQSDAGFNYPLLEEGNAYITGLAAVSMVGEFVPYTFSARDGALSFMYFLELYLRKARQDYPSVYSQLQSEPVIVEMVKTQWLRMNFFIAFADEFDTLGVYDDQIRQLTYAPENMQEIALFIGRAVDTTNCLP